MFPWSEKSKKLVTFNQEVADQSLLEVVESELMKHPQKTFSDLCKEALWQFLCVPESVRPTRQSANPQAQAPDLQRQLAQFEERFFARESSRLDAIERQLNQLTQIEHQLNQLTQSEHQLNQLTQSEHQLNQLTQIERQLNQLTQIERQLNQLTQQVAQLALKVNQQPTFTPVPQVAEAVDSQVEAETPTIPQEVDPLLSRLSTLVDDF